MDNMERKPCTMERGREDLETSQDEEDEKKQRMQVEYKKTNKSTWSSTSLKPEIIPDH